MKTFDVFNIVDLTPYYGETPTIETFDAYGGSNSCLSSSEQRKTDERMDMDHILLIVYEFMARLDCMWGFCKFNNVGPDETSPNRAHLAPI